MYKIKFSLIRTIEVQSFQEFELTDEQKKDFENLKIKKLRERKND